MGDGTGRCHNECGRGAGPVNTRIRNFRELTEDVLGQAARILMQAMAHIPYVRRAMLEAMEEFIWLVAYSDRCALGAFEGDELRGWIGAIRHSQFQWGLHPMAVDPAYQRQGWGRRVVRALEDEARAAGVTTIW